MSCLFLLIECLCRWLSQLRLCLLCQALWEERVTVWYFARGLCPTHSTEIVFCIAEARLLIADNHPNGLLQSVTWKLWNNLKGWMPLVVWVAARNKGGWISDFPLFTSASRDWLPLIFAVPWSPRAENCVTAPPMPTYVWFKYDLGQKYHAPQVQPGWGLNSWPPDHDSTFHVTETPAMTTRPSVTVPLLSWKLHQPQQYKILVISLISRTFLYVSSLVGMSLQCIGYCVHFQLFDGWRSGHRFCPGIRWLWHNEKLLYICVIVWCKQHDIYYSRIAWVGFCSGQVALISP